MELTSDQALQYGLQAHGTGDFAKADMFYTAILTALPNHPDANHNMGALASDVGQTDTALYFFKTALEADSRVSQYWLSYIEALLRLGQTDDAILVMKQAKTVGAIGREFDQIEKRLKRFAETSNALDSIKITTLHENSALIAGVQEPMNDYTRHLVNLYNQGYFREVKQQAEKLLKHLPKSITLHNIMGVSQKSLGMLESALDSYDLALAIKVDYIDAFQNASQLLKTYTPSVSKSHKLFDIDNKIKRLSPSILESTSNSEIIDHLKSGLIYLTESGFEYRTPLSQIYKRNSIDLNCKRHKKIFDTKHIIPEYCFGCFKVQVEVDAFIDLIKLTSLFYRFEFERDLTRKTIVELRPDILGDYKGLIYCDSLVQAEAVKELLDISMKEVFDENIVSKIKRGCSEFPVKYPNFGKIPDDTSKMMSVPREWKMKEKQFDQNELIEPKEKQRASLNGFCLSDFYVIQKWIDYAKGKGDRSVSAFDDSPIIYKDVYEFAKTRQICR